MSKKNKTAARQLLVDPELRQEIANAALADPEVMVSLANDIASDLSNVLQDDPTMIKQIIDTAISNPQFKQMIVKKLVEELAD